MEDTNKEFQELAQQATLAQLERLSDNLGTATAFIQKVVQTSNNPELVLEATEVLSRISPRMIRMSM